MRHSRATVQPMQSVEGSKNTSPSDVLSVSPLKTSVPEHECLLFCIQLHHPKVFETSSLVKMKNLKLLQLNYVKLIGSYENFPDLRWLRWSGCNLKTIPPGLLSSFLVALYMHSADLEEFDPPTVLNSLKLLDLSFSHKLVSICNFHKLPKLEELFLVQCISLTHVCKTIGY